MGITTGFSNGRTACFSNNGLHIFYLENQRLYHRHPSIMTDWIVASAITSFTVCSDGTQFLLVAFIRGGIPYARISFDAGNTWGSQTQLSKVKGSMSMPSSWIWQGVDGPEAIVAWGLGIRGSNVIGLNAAHYKKGVWSTPERLDNGNTEALFPSVHGTNRIGVVWRDMRSEKNELYLRIWADGKWEAEQLLFTGMDPHFWWSELGTMHIGYHKSDQSIWYARSIDEGITWTHTRLAQPAFFASLSARENRIVVACASYTERSSAKDNTKRSVGILVSEDGGLTWPDRFRYPPGEHLQQVLATSIMDSATGKAAIVYTDMINKKICVESV